MLLTYTFFQNALIGALLASVLCAIIGTYVVTRRMVIAGGGMAHASLGGVGLGAYFGFSSTRGLCHCPTMDVGHGFRHTLCLPCSRLYDGLALLPLWRHTEHIARRPYCIRTTHPIHHCGIRPSATYDYKCGLRCKLCPYARHSCYDHRIRYDTAHSSHHRRLPPHGRHRDGHLTTQCAPNDGRPLCPHL